MEVSRERERERVEFNYTIVYVYYSSCVQGKFDWQIRDKKIDPCVAKCSWSILEFQPTFAQMAAVASSHLCDVV